MIRIHKAPLIKSFLTVLRTLARLSCFPYEERPFKLLLIGDGIEIGGLNRPMRLTAKARVRYVDKLDTEGLRRNFPELSNVDIVNVNIVADVSRLDSIIPSASLDFVVANHVIEHVDNPLRVLMQFHRILRVGGLVHLAIPDKRATYDKDRPRTTLAHLIADLEHVPGDEKDANDIQHYQEWVQMVSRYLPKASRDYHSDLDQLWADRFSIHLHVWEPNDWPEIINYLNHSGYPFRLLDYSSLFAPEDRDEFVLILRKEEIELPLLPYLLPDRGPFRWRIAILLRRTLLINRIKKAVRPLLRALSSDKF